MDTRSYKTIFANKATAKKNWVLIDAQDQVVGRLASKVAYMLMGKHKTDFTPNTDNGDNVVIINCEKIRFTGKKLTDKEYIRYTGYPGGQRFGHLACWDRFETDGSGPDQLRRVHLAAVVGIRQAGRDRTGGRCAERTEEQRQRTTGCNDRRARGQRNHLDRRSTAAWHRVRR